MSDYSSSSVGLDEVVDGSKKRQHNESNVDDDINGSNSNDMSIALANKRAALSEANASFTTGSNFEYKIESINSDNTGDSSNNNIRIIDNDNNNSSNIREGTRNRIDFSDPDVIVMKVLCPTSHIGAILGKGGSIITELNKQCRTKLSQHNEYYPGTTDRVCVVAGNKTIVGKVLQELVTRLVEAHILKSSGSNPTGAYGASSTAPPTMRVLIPVSASGIIIGKGGATIKQLSDSSGCKMSLPEPADLYGTQERIMGFTSVDSATIVRGVMAVFAEMVKDPLHAAVFKFPNTKNTYETANMMKPQQQQIPGMKMPQQYMQLDQGRPTYGIQAAPHYANMNHPYRAVTNAYEMPYQQQPYGFPPQQQQQAAGAPTYDLSQFNISGPTYSTEGATLTMIIGVPDNIIASVLGKAGMLLRDVTMATGCKVTVAQKGDYIPGTVNRPVTIIGSQGQVQAGFNGIMANIVRVNNNRNSGGSGIRG